MTPSSSRPLRKVVIINTADMGGGAERLSMAVLDGFAALGTDTWLLVGNKKTDHPRVMPLFLSPYFDYRPYDKMLYQAMLGCRRRFDRQLGLEDFTHPYSHQLLELTGSAPDLVLCHNLHGGYFDIRALPALSRRVPVVAWLPDSWLMTGHCGSTLGCGRWETGCGRGPDLTIPPAISRDATRFNWRRKAGVLARTRLYAAAESQWMLDRIRRSMLAPAIVADKLIPGGVDLDVFKPGPRAQARKWLGLDPDSAIALYVANCGPANPYKDFSTVRQALAELARRDPGRRLLLLAAGADAAEERFGPGIAIRWLGYIRSQPHLAMLYRAADLFVHASLEEAHGISHVEALACGTPVVIASRGGVLESIEDERTALVVTPRAPVKLAEAMARLLDDPQLRAALGAAGAASAKARFDIRTSVGALHGWCSEILASWRAQH